MTLENLISQTGVSFGTSGVRALAKDITDQVAFLYTTSFIQFVEKRYSILEKTIVLAGDRRPSTPRILNAVASACTKKGYKVIYGGNIPTPALSYYGFVSNYPSIMVTGSHIPFDRNGIKFNKPDGELLKEDEVDLKSEVIEDENPNITNVNLVVDPAVKETYINRYLEFFPKNFLTGKRIGVYGHSSVTREIFFDVLTKLGADVTKLGFTEDFVPIDTDAIREEDRVLYKQWEEDHDFDAIVSADGDGDRPMVGDDKGEIIIGDVLDTLVSKYLGATTVACPVMCNTAIEKSALFNKVIRTKIGSPYVIKAMMDNSEGVVVGFEANGGFVLGSEVTKNGKSLKPLMTRDALLPILAILALAIEEGKQMSQMFSNLPKRYTYNNRLKDFPTEKSKELIAELKQRVESTMSLKSTSLNDIGDKVTQIDETDGLRLTLENGDIFQLRPSGNAPELRCYVESETAEKAKELNEKILKTLVG